MSSDLLDGKPLTGYDQEAVDAAAALVRNHCGWHIAPSVTEVLTVDGSGSSTLMLPTGRITAVTSVTEHGVLVDSDQYDWYPAGYLLGSCWSVRARAVQVALTHGYDECPPEVRAVVARIAKAGIGAPILASAGTGPFSASFVVPPGVIDEYSAAALERYRLPTRA